jgi:hypothetical protein
MGEVKKNSVSFSYRKGAMIFAVSHGWQLAPIPK